MPVLRTCRYLELPHRGYPRTYLPDARSFVPQTRRALPERATYALPGGLRHLPGLLATIYAAFSTTPLTITHQQTGSASVSDRRFAHRHAGIPHRYGTTVDCAALPAYPAATLRTPADHPHHAAVRPPTTVVCGWARITTPPRPDFLPRIPRLPPPVLTPPSTPTTLPS